MKSNAPLSPLIDRVNAACFWGEALSSAERTSLARAIAATHDQEGAYARTFALTANERKAGVLLFTGERATSASARHITGEEACRALRLLKVKDRAAESALHAATESLLECLERSERDRRHRMGGNPGSFCCGRCSVSVWRHILVGGFDRHEERQVGGLRMLKKSRDSCGRWRYFPFWYTAAALAEFSVSAAREEICYAAPLLERAANRKSPAGEYDRRRSEIARRALGRI